MHSDGKPFVQAKLAAIVHHEVGEGIALLVYGLDGQNNFVIHDEPFACLGFEGANLISRTRRKGFYERGGISTPSPENGVLTGYGRCGKRYRGANVNLINGSHIQAHGYGCGSVPHH